MPRQGEASFVVDQIKLSKNYENHLLSIFEQELEGLLVKKENDLIELLGQGKHALILMSLPAAKPIVEKGIISLASLNKGRPIGFLNNIYIADSFEVALKCQKKYTGTNNYFIFEDKILTPHGSIRFADKKESSILQLRRRTDELQCELDSLSKEDESLNIKLTYTKNKERLLKEQINVVVEKADELKGVEFEARAKIAAAKSAFERLCVAKLEIESKIVSHQARKEELSKTISGLEMAITKNSKELDKLREKLDICTAGLEESNGRVNKLNEELAVKTSEQASLIREIEQLKKNHKNSLNLAGKRLEKVEKINKQIGASQFKLNQLEKLRNVTAMAYKKIHELGVLVNQKKTALIKKLEKYECLRNELEKKNRYNNLKVHEIDHALSDLRIKQAEIKVKLSDLKEKLEEELDTDIDTAIGGINTQVPTSTIKEELKKVKSLLSRIGAVNLIALDELASLREREALYREQLDDLKESRKALIEVIKELDHLIISAFSEFFEKFSENFQIITESFFHGGGGKLSLSNSDDILNCGIEIEIQPTAGKKFQSLSLLSGGERTMSALAFMFSLYMTRPSPFCVMDEVDAALDDFNINKLVTFLEKMKNDSQIILITHQKRTMEAADIIFGVSMEPDGTSKVLSRKLEVIA